MTYNPTNWQTGETITAEKLNKLENGVSALSNYDIVFTTTEDSFTADGLSFEELFQKGARNLDAALDDKGIFEKATGFAVDLVNDVNTVMFVFALNRYRISLLENGEVGFNSTTGTYTYSNGHYVFTMDGALPK